MFPVLHTGRLLLRRFNNDDLDHVYQGLSHPDVIKYYGVSYHSLEAAKAQMQFFKTMEENGTGIWWALCSPDNQLFYGAAGLNNLRQEHRRAEVGFWLLPGYWGKGFIAEAVPLICDHGFQRLGLHRIEALVESENINSKKALAKLKFIYEGTMKDYEIKDGKFISLDIYSKLVTGN